MTGTARIDGRSVPAGTGETILEAAARAGIAIPRLCHDPRLSTPSSCRLCVSGPKTSFRSSSTSAPGMGQRRRSIRLDLRASSPKSARIGSITSFTLGLAMLRR